MNFLRSWGGMLLQWRGREPNVIRDDVVFEPICGRKRSVVTLEVSVASRRAPAEILSGSEGYVQQSASSTMTLTFVAFIH